MNYKSYVKILLIQKEHASFSKYTAHISQKAIDGLYIKLQSIKKHWKLH